MTNQTEAEALDDWRWKQAQESARKDGYADREDWYLAVSARYRRLVREDVRPEPALKELQRLGQEFDATQQEPAQEPVKWMYERADGACEYWPERRFDGALYGWTETPLYAHPTNLPDLLRTPEARAEIKRQGGVEASVVDEAQKALEAVDALIEHQYSGSRDAMSDLTYAAMDVHLALAKLKEARSHDRTD